MSRGTFVKNFIIREQALINLIEDLLQLADSSNNRAIMHNAFLGDYSDSDSIYPDPTTMLIAHLTIAAKGDSSYNELVEAAKEGDYEHNRQANAFADVMSHNEFEEELYNEQKAMLKNSMSYSI